MEDCKDSEMFSGEPSGRTIDRHDLDTALRHYELGARSTWGTDSTGSGMFE